MDELLPDFLAETTEALAECDTLLVRLEQAPGDAATLGQIFRLVHTIKGTCGFLGLSRLEKVAHAAENLLGKFRDGALAATPGRVTVVLGALDVVRRIVAGLEQAGREPDGDDASLIAALDAACRDDAPPASAPAPVAEPAAGRNPPPPPRPSACMSTCWKG